MNLNPSSPNEYFVVPEEWDGERLDLFLARKDAARSRGYFQKLIANSQVLINELAAAKPGQTLRTGDKVKITGILPSLTPPLSEDRPLDVIYEDEDILVINKPAALTVHPTATRSTGTLVNSLLYHSMQIADAVYDVHSLVSKMRPGIVHRLDKDTSGVMVVAKNQAALLNLAEQFRKHQVTKEYTALLYGRISEPTTIAMNIRRKPAAKNLMGVSTRPNEGREAVTHIYPEKEFAWPATQDDLTLVRCRIETGRTHQIRVHAKYCGHPVVGDPVYSNKPARRLNESLQTTRQLLHASLLELHHPKTSQKLSFTAPLPPDFEEILTKLRAT